ncbi:MAG: hypothetical protein HY288_05605 [Planctomycetia bacterium]|nr:hypothetical protein [Planctomycetia bacterium]
MLLLGSLSASSAFAQNGIGVIGAPGAYGFGFFNYGAQLNNSSEHIPFYALYPPVYYSYPVARPYGYSPFAYPPGVATPATPPAAAQYLNPYVPPKAEPKPASERTAGPRMYFNPFVKQAPAASSVSLLGESTR